MAKRKQNYTAARKKDKERKREERQNVKKLKYGETQAILKDGIDHSENHASQHVLDVELHSEKRDVQQDLGVEQQSVRDRFDQFVFAHFDQSNEIFPSYSRGRQCTCNSLIMLTQIGRSVEFTSDFMDWVLIEGDVLYRQTIQTLQESGRFKSNYLLFEELPTSISLNHHTSRIDKMNIITGVVLHEMNLDCNTLDEGLHEWAQYADSGLLLVNSLCSAVFKHDNCICFFDSHAHDQNGMSCPDGQAVLMRFIDMSRLIAFLYQYYASTNSLKNIQFEILPLTVVNENILQINPCVQEVSENVREEVGSDAINISLIASRHVKRLEQMRQHFRQNYRDKAFRNEKIIYEQKRYSNAKLRQLKQTKCKQHYRNNLAYKSKILMRERMKYSSDKDFQERVKGKSKQKYNSDKEFQEMVKATSKQKYSSNKEFQEMVKATSKQKYSSNKEFQEMVKATSKQKYRSNKDFQEKVKASSKQKYTSDKEFQSKVIQQALHKYRTDISHRENTKKTVLKTRHINKIAMLKMQNVLLQFKRNIVAGPDCICCVCHKLKFRRQVIVCKENSYKTKSKQTAAMAEKCITHIYFHQCNDQCSKTCETAKTPRSELWICYTCHRTILKAQMPCDASINNLQLEQIPDDLNDLNKLERHLISLRIPFMKMVSLPKGGQYGMAGPVTGVPCNIEQTTNTLPRCEEQSKLIQVKLKKKLPFKGHYQYQFISTRKIEMALKILINGNIWYSDVNIDSSWENPIEEISGNDSMEMEETTETTENTLNESSEDVVHANPTDTCLQPVDVGQEVLDQYFDNIFCVAPAEGKTPVRMLQEKGNEAMSFPVQFPGGRGSLTDDRDTKLSVHRYFQSRLLNADNRFSSDSGYVFYAQYLSELYQIISNVSIALRKDSNTFTGGNIKSNTLKDSDFLKQMLKSDQGYKFLKPVRGTPPYWQATLKDLFSMLRQLGMPTWFCSFSSADLRWDEVINTVFRQQGSTRNASELTWMEKCEILRNNPVTAIQMFANRWHLFLHEVILSDANPIGKILDHFFRIEFQMRGSPHVHALFWVENAPLLDTNTDDEVCDFIDKYISCELPSEDDENDMYEIINSVQMHSKKHSVSCRKKGTECRFNFPRPPSCSVFINRSDETDPEQVITREAAVKQLQELWRYINTCEIDDVSTDYLLLSAGLTQEMFERAMNKVTNKTTVQLKRRPADLWVNNYNPDLLKCWDANMDIQYVTDAYSCMMYVVSYISKSEREMGMVLEQARKEALEQNVDAQNAMKKIGGAYLHQREISAQEACYRVCGLPLKGCSRKVQFIPVGENIVRMSKPLKLIQSMSEDSQEDDIWMPSSVDRYKARPNSKHFDNMCLATFCSEYRIIYQSQVPKKARQEIYQLQNNLGLIQKRSRTNNAIIRYPRFSVTKVPEQYYLTHLQLFLPHRTESQLKPDPFVTYSDFYKAGAVKVTPTSDIKSVCEIVEENRLIYDRYSEQFDNAEELMENVGPMEDAWAQICPETEAERLECEAMKSKDETEGSDDDIPDLISTKRDQASGNSMEIQPGRLPREQIFALLRTLNTKQREIFFQIRQYCIDLSNGKKRDPFHVFITGGAGTGKSHLIKCIYHECQRILAPTLQNLDDTSVLFLAPTGTAAFNVAGNTIHSALSLGRQMAIPCIPLSDGKINTLRSKLGSLQLVIIDEISMVGKNILEYVHDRLKQIKKTSHEEPFGNISVIAVGDFFLLPPVKGIPLFKTDPARGRDLWLDYFTIAELDEIMRQKGDSDFAALLNRLRVRPKSQPINEDDIRILQSRQADDCPSDILHAFGTNAEVRAHNEVLLEHNGQDIISVMAQDFHKDPRSGKMVRCETPYTSGSDCLQDCLKLSLTAKVMLVRNIDIHDGLVNGAVGTIVKFIYSQRDELVPHIISVKFDNQKVGLQARQSSSAIASEAVAIQLYEEGLHIKHAIRRQFPLVLCWACTIHKTQGLTTDHICASFQKVNRAGMAYVVLSRATSLKGLYIQNLKLDSIFCDDTIKTALTKMKPFQLKEHKSVTETHITNGLRIVYHNVQGLLQHKADIEQGTHFLQSDVVCMTETWLQNEITPQFNGFTAFLKSRFKSYNDSHQLLKSFKKQIHGGVGIYYSGNHMSPLNFQISNIEVVGVLYLQNIAIITIYRPSSYPVKLFCQNLKSFLLQIDKTGIPKVIIAGDFNENILEKIQTILDTMTSKGYNQVIHSPTTEGGTLIDHVYVRGIEQDTIETSIISTYFSFHDAIEILIGL